MPRSSIASVLPSKPDLIRSITSCVVRPVLDAMTAEALINACVASDICSVSSVIAETRLEYVRPYSRTSRLDMLRDAALASAHSTNPFALFPSVKSNDCKADSIDIALEIEPRRKELATTVAANRLNVVTSAVHSDFVCLNSSFVFSAAFPVLFNPFSASFAESFTLSRPSAASFAPSSTFPKSTFVAFATAAAVPEKLFVSAVTACVVFTIDSVKLSTALCAAFAACSRAFIGVASVPDS